MSRTSLHTPRPPRAVWLRPATGTRLLPSPFPPTVPLHTPHYKRCPKALRLRLRSDQSLSRPVHATGYGRSPDKTWLALSKGPCQVRAPLTRRIRFASSGDAPEHSVMSLPRAIAPLPDSPGLDLAGESEQSDNLRLKTNAPFRDSTVVTIGDLRSTNAGHGSTLPSLGVVEHFWWSRPHRETISRLLHILSEVRGCRRAVADVKRIGTGVDAVSRNRPGPSIPSPSRFLRHSCGGRSQMRQGVNPSPEGQGPRSSGRTLPSLSFTLVRFPSRDDRPVAQRVGAPIGASTPFPLPFTIPRLREESQACPLTLPPSHLTPLTKGPAYQPISPTLIPGKIKFSRKTIKIHS